MSAGAVLAPQTKHEGRLEDYSDLRSWGLTRRQAAERMHVTLRTAERYESELRRRRQDGGALVSDQGNGGPRRIWTADEIEERLDEIGKVLSRAPGEILRGFLFGPGPSRRQQPRPKPQRPEKPEERKS